MWLLSKWDIVEALELFGGGLALEDTSRNGGRHFSLGLLSRGRGERGDFFTAERKRSSAHSSKRLAVVAGACGHGAGLPYLFARVERGGGVGLSPRRNRGTPLPADAVAREILDVGGNLATRSAAVRLGYAGQPTAIALRRPPS